METECVVFGCINSATSTERKQNNCKFFRFPLDRKELTDKWLVKLCLEGWHPGPENVVCEDHFSPESFDNDDGNVTLKPDAIPFIVGGLQRIVFETEQGSYDECVENLDGKYSQYRCRICAKHLLYENAIHIHSENENVVEKMMACIPVLLVKMEDNLPKYICRSCLVDLNVSYRMLVRAIESQKFFYSLITDSNNESNVIFENEGNVAKKQNDIVLVPSIDNCDREKLVDEFIYEDVSVLNECTNASTDLKNSTEVHQPSYTNIVNNDDSLASSTVLNCVESQTQWICNTCKVDFISKEALALHLENTSEICLEPKISEAIEDPLKIEKLVENQIESMLCDPCDFSSSNLEIMVRRHISHVVSRMPRRKKRENSSQTVRWTCKLCGKKLASKMNLTIHERSHTGDRPFVCEHCGYTFKSNANLIQHSLVHSADKKFVCTICNKAFVRKEFLNTHKRVHTGERPYHCSICGNRFTQIGDMHRHRKKHLGT